MNRNYQELDSRGRWQLDERTKVYDAFKYEILLSEFLERLSIDKIVLNEKIYANLRSIGYTTLNGQIKPEDKQKVQTIEWGNINLEIVVKNTKISEIRERVKPSKKIKIKFKKRA